MTEAVYYLLRRKGLSARHAKAVTFAIRWQIAGFYAHDLSLVRAVDDGSRHVLKMANRQLAYSAVKLTEDGTLPTAVLAEVQEHISTVDTRLASLPCPDKQASLAS